MITIRREQLQDFARNSKRDFIDKTAASLPKYYPEWCKDKNSAKLKNFVSQVVDYAHANHIYGSHCIYDILNCDIKFGLIEMLANNPELRKRFGDKSKPEKVRVHHLKNHLVMLKTARK